MRPAMTLEGMFAAMPRNNAWANRRLHEACRGLPDDGFRAPRGGFFGSISRTLNHILIVDWYYLDQMSGAGLGYWLRQDEEPYPILDDLIEAQRAADRRLIAFCDGLGPADLARTVPMERPGRKAPDERIGDLLAHLFQHQVHHRGQAHGLLSDAGIAPPQLDEFFLVDDGRFRGDDMAALRDLGLD